MVIADDCAVWLSVAGLNRFLGALAKLPGHVVLGVTLISKWGYRLTSFPQSGRTGAKASKVCCLGS